MRRYSKSIAAIYFSSITKSPICCLSEGSKKFIENKAKHLGLEIPTPILIKKINLKQ